MRHNWARLRAGPQTRFHDPVHPKCFISRPPLWTGNPSFHVTSVSPVPSLFWQTAGAEPAPYPENDTHLLLVQAYSAVPILYREASKGRILATYLCLCSADHSDLSPVEGRREGGNGREVKKKNLMPRWLSVTFIIEGLLTLRGKVVWMNLSYVERNYCNMH